MPTNPHNKADRTPHRNSVLRELRAMQATAFALIQDSEVKPSDKAHLMRGYVLCEQQRNVLKMRPVPKPIDVTNFQRKLKAFGGSLSNVRVRHLPASEGSVGATDSEPGVTHSVSIGGAINPPKTL
jgi:hypothetical protein